MLIFLGYCGGLYRLPMGGLYKPLYRAQPQNAEFFRKGPECIADGPSSC
jgi:hypothetical protein